MVLTQLPEELIVEILLQLPVKSILRFKCLSKSLDAVIETPNFINSHNLICSSSQNLNKHKLIFNNNSRRNKLIQSCDVNIVDSEEEILRLGKSGSSLWSRVCGYCKGLLLLRRTDTEFILWNPSTRQFRNLPNCTLDSDLPYKRTILLGLGYDDSIDDYKVFCIVRVRDDVKPTLKFQVWMCGLKSNIWRRALDYPYNYNRYPGMGYFTDGSLHWLIEHERKSEIVAFDMRKETFSLISRPDCLYGVLSKLHVLEGCLCISFSTKDELHDYYFYVRNKDGIDKFTWTKLFSVTRNGTSRTILPWNISFYDDGYQNVKALRYSKNGDKILLCLSPYVMVWYNLENKSFEKVQRDSIDGHKWHDPILCVESLVSLRA